ncbi:MAG: magnesium/cobalt transporter CorA [Phycisphaerales bacterium]
MDSDVAHPSGRVPIIRRTAVAGTSPGTLAVDPDALSSEISVIGFGPEGMEEADLADASEIDAHCARWPVVWINVNGLGDESTLRDIADRFSLHPLALEDVVNVPQRAKVEPYDEHLFVVARMIEAGGGIATEQVSIFVGDGFVLTFQERPGDSFGQVRTRIRKGLRRIRTAGSDYLAYALIDALIDGFFPAVEAYGDRLEALEEEVLANPEGQFSGTIHAIKRDLLVIRRALSPHRELLHSLIRDESEFVSADTHVYLRDCLDHTIQLLDTLETYREISSGLLDVHLATVSNRMNEVMKVLTIFAAIFIPLSFIVGLYGMNFNQDSPWNMPELQWRYGYPVLVCVLGGVAAGLLYSFRRKRWI